MNKGQSTLVYMIVISVVLVSLLFFMFFLFGETADDTEPFDPPETINFNEYSKVKFYLKNGATIEATDVQGKTNLTGSIRITPKNINEAIVIIRTEEISYITLYKKQTGVFNE